MKTSASATNSTSNYGGLKKGFLFSNNQPKTPNSSSRPTGDQKDIPLIKPSAQQNSLEIPEIQQAMQAADAFTKNTGMESNKVPHHGTTPVVGLADHISGMNKMNE